MKQIIRNIPLFATFLGLATIPTLRADLNLPEASQLAINKQRVGLTDITITYHRPLVNGRKIWGGLVRLERFGALARTKTLRSNSAIRFPWKANRSRKGFTDCI